ncbi:hypothetical protein HGRIS_008754 [Hohenbuehelia grisea]|uniref:Fungal-type protein kinase domain-containing protein n=1 Tax=Hohenbuehelia grisea TaxID=104357 RepID=A0ABR3J8W6_9AGAR
MDPASASRQRPNVDDLSSPSTPKKSTTVSVDTPYRHTSSITTSGNLSTQLESGTKIRQEELLRRLQSELGAATHESKLTCDTFCPDPSDRATAILNDLHQSGVFTHSPGAKVIAIPTWPVRTDSRSGETRYYPPFVAILNAIVAAFKKLFPKATSYYVKREVKFFVYDKEMAEAVEFSECLKPDILGALANVFNGVGNCSWFDAELFGEFKKDWKKLLAQAGSYARSAFAAGDNRLFVPSITFNHVTSIFRLCFFHRGGVIATPPMNILTYEGFKGFVTAITGMWNWENAEAAGHYTAQTHSHFSFNEELYQIDKLFCRRICVRGRATRVFGLRRELTMSAGPPPLLKERLERRGDPLEPLLRPKSAKPEQTVKLDRIKLPESLALKCSYPLAQKDREEDIFRPVKQYIGIVDIIAAYDVECVQAPASSTYWKIFELDKKNAVDHAPEVRLHRHLLFRTVGQPLKAARGPRELGLAVLYGMIGHCALFTVGGYVHRDVSSGNILLLDRIEEREIPPCLADIVTAKDCAAVLADGDAAKKWGDTSDLASHRSGTKPFIASRLIDNWQNTHPAKLLHTPIDDLESFIWVLYYTILEISDPKTLPEVEQTQWRLLNSDLLGEVSGVKFALLVQWTTRKEAFEDHEYPARLLPFRDLFLAWFETSNVYVNSLTRLLAKKPPSLPDIKALSEKAYKQYIKEGLQHISSLPEDFP